MGVVMSEKKQITLSFKTKDSREIELYEFFSQAMGRQSLMKGILWEYYQKNKNGDHMAPLEIITNYQQSEHKEPDQEVVKEVNKTVRRNVPKGGALALL